MERISIIFFSFCSLAILAGTISANSSTNEILQNNTHDISDVENYHINLLKPRSVQNDVKQSSVHENLVKNITQDGEHDMKNSSFLNKTSDTFASSTGDILGSYIKDMQISRFNRDQKSDAETYREGSTVGLSSHDILLDPGLISARPSRQAEKSDMNYSNLASIESISGDTSKSDQSVDSKSIVPSRVRSSNFKGDLGVAEDRYQPPYPYWYYRGQFPNERYRPYDRREPYHNYLRYPVFPGK
ncbi:hypothetical protein P5V15_000904 [Pogonomyrmex californicus]